MLGEKEQIIEQHQEVTFDVILEEVRRLCQQTGDDFNDRNRRLSDITPDEVPVGQSTETFLSDGRRILVKKTEKKKYIWKIEGEKQVVPIIKYDGDKSSVSTSDLLGLSRIAKSRDLMEVVADLISGFHMVLN